MDAVLAAGGARRACMAKAIAALAKPNAAFAIADAILQGELRTSASDHAGGEEGEAGRQEAATKKKYA